MSIFFFLSDCFSPQKRLFFASKAAVFCFKSAYIFSLYFLL
ncbi:hypothetical protein HMPREF0653_02834 [Prevotella disiens JCM 6334 = ATCC 29426]|uniref:Uncharacterized protein n=1 Tax=Prevotella disiens JCM 6334 = ATCC 29426 TaxID=1235811 RepID=A0ABP2Y7E4_9BACT|nr:hypothetical protein HMPREF0653_02834 [Prevotella disiens JCM 6334 = ATCC 29426]